MIQNGEVKNIHTLVALNNFLPYWIIYRFKCLNEKKYCVRCVDQTNFVLSYKCQNLLMPFRIPITDHCIIYSAFSPCLARFRKRSKVCWCRSRDMKDEVILVDKISNLGAAPAPMPLSFLDEIQSATEKKWNMALVEGNWSKLNRKNMTKKRFLNIKKMSHLCLGQFFLAFEWC